MKQPMMSLRTMRAVIGNVEPRLNKNAVSQIMADMRAGWKGVLPPSIADVERYVHGYIKQIEDEEKHMHRLHTHIPIADPMDSLNEHADELAYESVAS